MRIRFLLPVTVLFFSAALTQARPTNAEDLRLVPFPKQVEIAEGSFALNRTLILEVPPAQVELLGQLVGQELKRCGLAAPKVEARPDLMGSLRLSTAGGGPVPAVSFREGATAEDYVLRVSPEAVTITGRGSAGLLYGTQTLCQLIRANSTDGTLSGLTVTDWPSIRWRGYQDDMTRGPSSTFATLQREVAMGAALKMNFFTYYMEYQFAFKKHPAIGPLDGSLTADELQSLVAFARPFEMEILGSQQSFGHLNWLLMEGKPYAHLRETSNTLTPAKEETYQLLDDLYSEVIPLLPFGFFNVCCDEVGGLGSGPAKEMVAQYGVAGTYVRHLQRIHKLVTGKYGKRMMMWGDIILHHPEHLKDIPTDTVMLTWGYGENASYEGQIIPFAKSGFDFFVCPGVSCWNRILPNFRTTLINIHNFVRDGAKHGTMGVLNTAWEDDAENFNSFNWFGYAWGADCSWNAATTDPEDFKRRVGAVLFGESGDHFGQAITLLAKLHWLDGMDGMYDRRFWSINRDWDNEADGRIAEELLALVRPAIDHLQACRAEATVNADLLDYFLFGARRMELIGRRMLDGRRAVAAYRAALKAEPAEAGKRLQEAAGIFGALAGTHEALIPEYRRLWLQENKPYALDRPLTRFERMAKAYRDWADGIALAEKNMLAGQSLPSPEKIGLVDPVKKDAK